jgi:putative membrane protein
MRIFIAAVIVGALSHGISAQGISAQVLTDAEFVLKAAQGGHYETESGKLGASKAANGAVKAFAERMITDHSAANDELVQLAASKGISITHGACGAPALNARAAGAEFDREFMHRMVRSHEDTLDLFEGESRNGKDADIRAWASSKLPALREHLREAREIYSKAYRIEYMLKQRALKKTGAASF